MTENIIILKDVWKIYQMGEVEVPALRGVSIEIKKGEFVAIIGQSGSGKSTMMNLVGCLDLPSKGEVFLKSHNISKISESRLAMLRGKTIGFIFQQYNLIPTMTALENVLLPLELLEVDDTEATKVILSLRRSIYLNVSKKNFVFLGNLHILVLFHQSGCYILNDHTLDSVV